jgi:hypothetical protein
MQCTGDTIWLVIVSHPYPFARASAALEIPYPYTYNMNRNVRHSIHTFTLCSFSLRYVYCTYLRLQTHYATSKSFLILPT